MGNYNDDDSDDGYGGRSYGGGSSYNRNSSFNNNSTSSSILKKPQQRNINRLSDDDEDDRSKPLSQRNRGGYDSPLASYRSDAGKPPSGRLPTMSRDLNKSEIRKPVSSTYSSSNGNKNLDDSDDSYSDNRFGKKNINSYDKSLDSKYDRFETKNDLPKYDKYDKKSTDFSKYDRFDVNLDNKKPLALAEPKKSNYERFDASLDSKEIKNKIDEKFYSRLDSKNDPYEFEEKKGVLKSTSTIIPNSRKLDIKNETIDSLDLYNKGQGNRNPRSTSLDRLNNLTSAYNQSMNKELGSSVGSTGRLNKFNSTSNLNNLENGYERSYTANSLNSTNLSIREARSRSFLVGSLSALNGKSLLGGEELERHLLDKRARVLVTTWNMGGIKKLSDNLDELLLPDMIQTMPDIYVIGVEEFEMTQKVWEINLQEQIGPSHVKYCAYYHGSVGITIFIKRELIWFCSIAEFEHINLRAGPINTPSATKASVLISFQLFGTLMCFICSHFAAGEGNVDTRIENYKTTINSIKLPNRLLTKRKLLANDGTDNFDCVFWFGDFNFRVDQEKSKVVNKILDVRKKRSINFEEIMNHDELYRMITEEKAFKNFLEGRITFEPSYKYEINSNEYDRSDKCRIPSYTDRILFRSRQKGIISCSFYDTVKDIKLSDHRPVYGLYEIAIRPGVDKIPLSFGDFDRQVYAAGYQKRQMFRACDVGFVNKTKKSPCSIM